jgi:PilZ domain-containing protein
MIERRAAQRRRILKQGTLTFSGGGSANCTVRSISSNGARIEIESPVGLPKKFTLVIASDHFKRPCHAVWSSNQLIGVTFD